MFNKMGKTKVSHDTSGALAKELAGVEKGAGLRTYWKLNNLNDPHPLAYDLHRLSPKKK